jgi:hypothetical protein
MMAAVQSEERDRISRFVFQRDAKSALVSLKFLGGSYVKHKVVSWDVLDSHGAATLYVNVYHE